MNKASLPWRSVTLEVLNSSITITGPSTRLETVTSTSARVYHVAVWPTSRLDIIDHLSFSTATLIMVSRSIFGQQAACSPSFSLEVIIRASTPNCSRPEPMTHLWSSKRWRNCPGQLPNQPTSRSPLGASPCSRAKATSTSSHWFSLQKEVLPWIRWNSLTLSGKNRLTIIPPCQTSLDRCLSTRLQTQR